MIFLKTALWQVMFAVVLSNSTLASPVVIAGSELNTPVAFQANSFFPVGLRIDRGFPFQVVSGGPFLVSELQIAAFHYQQLTGNNATYSIHEESQGVPGDEIGTFDFHDISTIAQIHVAMPHDAILLNENIRYWIVGHTTQEQVNWNLSPSAHTPTTVFRLDGGEWMLQEKGNLAAFAILGTPIPEPTTLALVDIKPGSVPNSVNLKSKGVLPVAILGTDEFDVTEVVFDSLLFGDPLLIDNGGTAISPLRSALEDVSGDGLLDLTLKFSTRDLVEYEALGPDTIEGLLTGELFDGTPFEGMDSIRIVPPNGSHGNSLQTSTVPEPTTCTLALAALCLAMSRRRAF